MDNIQQKRYLNTKNAVDLYFEGKQDVPARAADFLCQKETQDIIYLVQLACSFPAIAYLLLTDQLPHKKRETTLEMVLSGAPMKDIAAFLELPMWLRKLEADAFSFPAFCYFLGKIPDEASFVRAITNLIPSSNTSHGNASDDLFDDHDLKTDHNAQQEWLKGIVSLSLMKNDRITLWIASQNQDELRNTPLDQLLLLLCWLWYQVTPKHTNLLPISKRERISHISLAKALERSEQWHSQNIAQNNISKDDYLASQADHLKQLRHQEAFGYSIKLLQSKEDFTHEGKDMENCIADSYNTNPSSLFFSISNQHGRCANAEIRVDDEDFSFKQLKGFKNSDIATEVKTEIRAALDLLHQKFAFDKIAKARSMLIAPTGFAPLGDIYQDFVESFPGKIATTFLEQFTAWTNEEPYGFYSFFSTYRRDSFQDQIFFDYHRRGSGFPFADDDLLTGYDPEMNLILGSGPADEFFFEPPQDDVIFGEPGADNLFEVSEEEDHRSDARDEDDSDDTLIGGSGDDILFGAYGNDTLDGGGMGDDRLWDARDCDKLTESQWDDWLQNDDISKIRHKSLKHDIAKDLKKIEDLKLATLRPCDFVF